MRLFCNTSFVAKNVIMQAFHAKATENEVVRNSNTPKLREAAAKLLTMIFPIELDIPLTRKAADNLSRKLIEPDCQKTNGQVWDSIDQIFDLLRDELEQNGAFFYAPAARAKHFDVPKPFGSDVSEKFPKLTEDIREAENCFACGRYTACVFHLMRIMEHGVQRLGRRLHVPKPETLVWQVILNQINFAIKALPPKQAKTKRLAGIASNLYNIKLAWRNEVMHPKATYTEEEAEKLITLVRSFMQHLAAEF